MDLSDPVLVELAQIAARAIDKAQYWDVLEKHWAMNEISFHERKLLGTPGYPIQLKKERKNVTSRTA